ncbi:MAG: RHH-type proline utilization regulon transcriptional repressor/proline dehydrogenase [Myxococcota bacterium]
MLYRAALVSDTLVTLDMEAFHDLELTLAVFDRVLREPEFDRLRAGIVLQAYLPESGPVFERLLRLAQARVGRGGSRIRVRLVKGANLMMEQVEAAIHGWPCPIFSTKAGVDAQYKRILHRACSPDAATVMILGVASHNLFDIAYAMVLRTRLGVEDAVGFEMLAGISPGLRRVVGAVAGDLLAYVPVVAPNDLQSAIAYLIRRLDENTAPQNFLRHSFDMAPGSEAWQVEEARFLASCVAAEEPQEPPHTPIVRTEVAVAPMAGPFVNRPDTDWAVRENRVWFERSLAAMAEGLADCPLVPLSIAGEDVTETSAGFTSAVDPSRPGVVPYRYVLADWDAADRALTAATEAAPAWSATDVGTRIRHLAVAAEGLEAARGALVATMVADAGKAATEGDGEVSEAIDFAYYYGARMAELDGINDVAFDPLGVVLVTPPWNFPLAIAAGGVFAALVAGNTVILKSAPETVLTARRLCEVLWDTGVPRSALQFLACENDPVGSLLIADERVNAVVLTGGTVTAKRFLKLRPDLHLLAETGGKNATIVTDMADTDLAIRDIVRGAFGHSGQKCSATSLLILEAAVYDDARFLARLADAVTSLVVGSSWDPAATVTPLIRAPRADLMRGLTTLDPGESWLVEPRVDPDNALLWSPGVKLGVEPGSWSHRTELFGPVLAVMRAANLDQAIAIANIVDYGLTSGLQSLDPREHARWSMRIEAGNAYVNRSTTGAIVQRQPFGGVKLSAWGPGAKAGGPNYVMQLTRPRDIGNSTADDYASVWKARFSDPADATRLLGQDNHLRYRPVRRLMIRVQADAAEDSFLRALAAAETCGVTPQLSVDPDCGWASDHADMRDARFEDDTALAARLGSLGLGRLRAILGACPLSGEVQDVCLWSNPWVWYETSPVSRSGRVELPRYLYEQAVSFDYHRFGNLGVRDGEPRGA